VATHDAAGHHPPLPVRRVRARVAARCLQGRRPSSEAVPDRAAVGAGGHRVPALDRRPGRRGARGVLEHRQHRRAGRGPPGPDRRSAPVRRRPGDRGRRALLAAHSPRTEVRHRRHRPDARACRDGPGAAAGHGGGPLQAGLQGLAGRASPGVARPAGGRRDGRVHRLQDRRRRRTARRRPCSRSVPRDPPRR